MLTILKGKTVAWADATNPTAEDLERLRSEFSLHPLIVATLRHPTRHPSLERFGDHFLLIVHIPVFDEKKRDVRSLELDIVAGKNFFISTHYQQIEVLRDSIKRYQDSPQTLEEYIGSGVGNLLYSLLDSIIDSLFPILDDLEWAIERIEEEIFRGRTKEMVNEISVIHRNVIDLRRALHPSSMVLVSMMEETRDLLEAQSMPYLKNLLARVLRITGILDAHKETVAALESTNQAILSTKINEVIKILTLVTAMAVPFTVVSGIWGMNILLPLQKSSFGLFIIFAIMTAISGTIYIWLRIKKWL